MATTETGRDAMHTARERDEIAEQVREAERYVTVIQAELDAAPNKGGLWRSDREREARNVRIRIARLNERLAAIDCEGFEMDLSGELAEEDRPEDAGRYCFEVLPGRIRVRTCEAGFTWLDLLAAIAPLIPADPGFRFLADEDRCDDRIRYLVAVGPPRPV